MPRSVSPEWELIQIHHYMRAFYSLLSKVLPSKQEGEREIHLINRQGIHLFLRLSIQKGDKHFTRYSSNWGLRILVVFLFNVYKYRVWIWDGIIPQGSFRRMYYEWIKRSLSVFLSLTHTSVQVHKVRHSLSDTTQLYAHWHSHMFSHNATGPDSIGRVMFFYPFW